MVSSDNGAMITTCGNHNVNLVTHLKCTLTSADYVFLFGKMIDFTEYLSRYKRLKMHRVGIAQNCDISAGKLVMYKYISTSISLHFEKKFRCAWSVVWHEDNFVRSGFYYKQSILPSRATSFRARGNDLIKTAAMVMAQTFGSSVPCTATAV